MKEDVKQIKFYANTRIRELKGKKIAVLFSSKADEILKMLDTMKPKISYVMKRRMLEVNYDDNNNREITSFAQIGRDMANYWEPIKGNQFTREFVRQLEKKGIDELVKYITMPMIINKNCPINSLDFNQHALNQLEKHGIKTIRDLTKMSYADLLFLKHIGVTGANNIKTTLEKYGYKLKGD